MAEICLFVRINYSIAPLGMDELDHNLLTAWNRVFERCRKDPAEARRRYQRMYAGGTYDRPVRAWCVAIRASDTRIELGRFAFGAEESDEPGRVGPVASRAQTAHEIVLDGSALQQLGGAVSIPYPGVPIDEAAKRLGKHKEALRSWLPSRPGRTLGERVDRGRGLGLDDKLMWQEFSPTQERPLGVRYVPQRTLGRGGNGPGMETPVVWSATALDPGAVKGRPPSKWWGTLWQSLASNIPAEFEQVLERVPRFVPYPEADGMKRPRFRGWYWRCPGLVGKGCGKQVAVLYAPLPVWTVGRHFDLKEGVAVDGLAGRWFPGVMDRWAGRRSLACERCWRLRRTSLTDYRGWNELVTDLSGGLLFGHEVRKPAGFAYERRRAYVKRQGVVWALDDRPTMGLAINVSR